MKTPAAFPVSRVAIATALLSFAAAATWMGARIDGYSHLQHPLALLGASPLPGATGFNLAGFVVPGVLVAGVMLQLRSALGRCARASWAARIGAQLALVSALAFAAQGLLPLDATDLDGIRSGRHAAAWMVWCSASAAGGLLLAAGSGRAATGAWRTLAAVSLLVAFAVPACALLLPHLVPAGVAQRLAFAAWFAWAVAAAHAVARGGVSRGAA